MINVQGNIQLIILFVIKVWYDYISVAGSLKRSNDMAILQGKAPLSKVMLGQQRIGYMLEAIIGSILISGFYTLLCMFVTKGILFNVLYAIAIFLALGINNVIYSYIANIYLNKKVKEVNMQNLQSMGNFPDSHNMSPELLEKLRKDYTNNGKQS